MSVHHGTGGRTAGYAQGSVGLSGRCSLVYVTTPDGTDGHAVGSGQSAVGIWWSVVFAAGEASGHQMGGCGAPQTEFYVAV